MHAHREQGKLAKKLTHKTRAIRKLEELGWTVGDVERLVRRGPVAISFDLFGFIDLVGVKGSKTLGLQVTSRANSAARVDKMLNGESVKLAACLKAKWIIECWGVRDKQVRDGSFAVIRYFELSDGGQTVTAYEGSSILKG